MLKFTGNYHNYERIPIARILVSPYLRVLQTAVPTAEALGLPLHIETGLSEAHATPQVLPTPAQRYAYFPQIDTTYHSQIAVHATRNPTVALCPKTRIPCEAFAVEYVKRIGALAAHLETAPEYEGKTVLLFSHAASVALVAALLRTSIRALKFAPCGIYHLERRRSRRSNPAAATGDDWSPWKLRRSGDSNTPYVSVNSSTTFPWGFSDHHFHSASTEQEEEAATAAPRTGVDNGDGTSEDASIPRRVDMEYFVPTNTERRTTATASDTTPPPAEPQQQQSVLAAADDDKTARCGVRASSSLESSHLSQGVRPLTIRQAAHSALEQHVAVPVTRSNRQPVLMLATTHKRRRRTNPDGTKTVLPGQAERRVCSIPGCNKKTPKLCTVCGKPVCDWERRPVCWKTHCDAYHTDM